MSIFDNLPNPTAPAQAFMTGMQQGRAEREARETRGALSAYAMNPDDPAAYQELAEWRPDLALQIREDMTKRQQAAQMADLQRRAAAGDAGALAELAGVDLDAWDKLADNDRQTAGNRVKAIGNAAMYIDTLPAGQRPAAWDAAIDQLSPEYPELAEYKGRYSEDALRGVISQAGLMQDFIKAKQPDYMAVPAEATLVNTRDPAAVTQFQSNRGAAPTPFNPDEWEVVEEGGASASRVFARVSRQVDRVERSIFDLFDRQASGTVPDYMAARQAYRRVSVLEDSVLKARNREDKMFTPAQLGQADRANGVRFGGKRAAARGGTPFSAYAEAGQAVLPNKVPDSGTAGRLLVPLALVGGGGGADAALGDGAGTGLTIGTILASLYSRTGQRVLTKPGRGMKAGTRRRQILDSQGTRRAIAAGSAAGAASALSNQQ